MPAAPAAPARPPSAARPAEPADRLFPPQDLGLLEAPDRDQWQKPDQIMDALGDCGRLGRRRTRRRRRLVHAAPRSRVGPNGLVYAEDIQPEMIEAHQPPDAEREPDERRTGARHADRSAAAAGARRRADRRTRITRWTIRRIRRVIVTLLRNVARSLKPQGRLGIVDLTPGGGGPGPRRESAGRSGMRSSRRRRRRGCS